MSTQERASSAVSFMDGMKDKIELLMKTADITDGMSKSKNRKKVITCPIKEKRLLKIVVKRRREGQCWEDCTIGMEWSGEVARKLIYRRGISL